MSGAVKTVKKAVKAVGKGISKVVEGVGKVVDKAIDIVKDVGSSINNYVIKPMLDNPIKAIATIGAIATGNVYLLPYINAADAVAQGGSLVDAAKAFGTTYIAGQAGAKVGSFVGQQTGSALAGDIASGAARGATGATITGGDIGQSALLGGVTAGVGSVIREGFSPQGTNLELAKPTDPESFLYESPPELGQSGSPFLGSGLTSAGMGQETLDPFASGVSGITAPPAPSVDFSRPVDYSLAAAQPSYTEQLRSGKISMDDSSTEGKQDYSVTPKQTTDSLIDSDQIKLLPDDVVNPSFDWNAVGKYFLRQGVNAVGRGLMANLMGPQYQTYYYPGSTYTGPQAEGGGDSGAIAGVNLAEVRRSKYENKKFVGPAGEKTTIPFKDDEPQIPIPAGYVEDKGQELPLQTMTAKKGGLAVKKERKPTTRKGLAAKKK
jgi:hypothetical protein